LIEVLIAMAVGLLVMAGIVGFLREGLDLSQLVVRRGDLQQNARAALNVISRDLSIAGTAIPVGGVQLPSGAGSTNPMFACDFTECHLLTNTYLNDRLYAVSPGDGLGPDITGVPSDVVTLVYADDRLNLSEFPLVSITASGDRIQVDAATDPPINDAAVGVRQGDVLMLCNSVGCAAGTVTADPAGQFIDFQTNDPLNFNQPAAAFGNIKSILVPAPPGNPVTTATRVIIVTYYIEANPGPDAALGTADDGSHRLMRQVNAGTPSPVADDIQDLQFTYDLYDEDLAVATADEPDAGGVPNQIREAHVTVSFRSRLRGIRGNYEAITLSTSVSGRNLSFRDRYE
jgi:hypothetical protein